MNLNCNCILNRYMRPSLYVQVKNYVHNCPIFFTVKYFFEGRWVTKTSDIISFEEHTRLYYEKNSSKREFTMYKRMLNRDIFIYSTIILRDVPVCYKVTGDNMHTFINEVPC